jgi:hypothetical protein
MLPPVPSTEEDDLAVEELSPRVVELVLADVMAVEVREEIVATLVVELPAAI